MFLVRSLFWLTAVVMVLPASEGDGEPPPRVGLLEAATAARTLAHDLTSVCSRHPEACETSRNAVNLFWRKLETGVALFSRDEPEQSPHGPVDKDQIGSLLEEDFAPAWSIDENEPAVESEPTEIPGS